MVKIIMLIISMNLYAGSETYIPDTEFQYIQSLFETKIEKKLDIPDEEFELSYEDYFYLKNKYNTLKCNSEFCLLFKVYLKAVLEDYINEHGWFGYNTPRGMVIEDKQRRFLTLSR